MDDRQHQVREPWSSRDHGANSGDRVAADAAEGARDSRVDACAVASALVGRALTLCETAELEMATMLLIDAESYLADDLADLRERFSGS